MTRLVARVAQGAAFYGSLAVLALVSLLWNLIALLLYPFLGVEKGRVIGRAGIAYGYRMFWAIAGSTGIIKLDAATLDPLAGEPGGLVIAANHPSLLDGVLIASRLPRTCCIMKASLMRNPFLGAGARLARYIANDHPLSLVKNAVADLKNGGQLIIFPEGTRSSGGVLNPFLPGITLIAKRAARPIQTVFIHTQSPYLSKGWPVWRMPPLPIVVRVRLGRRFAPQADHAAWLTRLEAYFRAELTPPDPGPATCLLEAK